MINKKCAMHFCWERTANKTGENKMKKKKTNNLDRRSCAFQYNFTANVHHTILTLPPPPTTLMCWRHTVPLSTTASDDRDRFRSRPRPVRPRPFFAFQAQPLHRAREILPHHGGQPTSTLHSGAHANPCGEQVQESLKWISGCGRPQGRKYTNEGQSGV